MDYLSEQVASYACLGYNTEVVLLQFVIAGDSQIMKLNGSQFKTIQESLLSGFSSRDQLAMMNKFELDEDLDSIADGETYSLTVFNLIRWAERTGNLRKLANGALSHNPDNSNLQMLNVEIEKWTQSQDASTSPHNPDKLHLNVLSKRQLYAGYSKLIQPMSQCAKSMTGLKTSLTVSIVY
ncbi:MAG: effector-associated domain EAD1-containing protein [Caldilineaceae bacterium]